MSDPQTTNRCPICDWPFAIRAEQGCVEGNCSYRPTFGTQEYYRIESRKDQLKRERQNETA
jgi:hypothetical protein